MRNRARTLERNDAYVRKFLVMARNSIIGAKGMHLQSKAGDWRGGQFVASKYDQRLIEDAYWDWSKAWEFSADGRLDRRRFAQIALQRIFVDGEFVARYHRGKGRFGLRLQMVDAEMLDHMLNRDASPSERRNEIRMGVEMDADGRPVAYHFLKEAPPTWAGVAAIGRERERVPADQVLHLYIQERPGQTRGVTWLAPTGLRAQMLGGLETAVTVGFRVAASQMGFFEPDETYAGGSVVEDPPLDCAPGEFHQLPAGMKFHEWSPEYPSADFDALKKSIVREMAGGLGVSYPELGNDFSGVSYSAGQIGVHSDAAFWADMQQFWADGFEEPVYREWLLMAITSGALALPISKLEKFQDVKFQPPRRKHIDPLKTHNAQRVALGDMSRSPFDIAAENGADFEDIVDETRRAIEMLKDAKLPVPASWGGRAELAKDDGDAGDEATH
jgi:lambda family phage portal protein